MTLQNDKDENDNNQNDILKNDNIVIELWQQSSINI